MYNSVCITTVTSPNCLIIVFADYIEDKIYISIDKVKEYVVLCLCL